MEAGQKFRYEDLLLVMLTVLPEEVWFAHFLRSSKLQPWSRDDQVYVARRTGNLNVFQQDFQGLQMDFLRNNESLGMMSG